MEAGDPGVSLDLLVQGLFAAGATQREIASALTPRKKALFAYRTAVHLRPHQEPEKVSGSDKRARGTSPRA
jgi:hypothetical protein